MSREKTTPAPEKSNEAEWVQKIKDLGESIGAKQRRFAELVGVSQNMVSKWHKGSKPSGEYFARMAQIAQDHGEGKLASHFRRLAVESSPAMIELQNRESPMPPTPFEDIPHIGVPLLRDSAAAGVGRIVNESDIEDIIYLPRSLCPHPERTRAIRVIGDSMSPILEDGYIVAVDVTVVEPAKLYNHMVAAVGPDGGVTIKWLRKIDNEVLLIPQHTSLRHPPQLISRASGWRIVGSVCLWIGVPK